MANVTALLQEAAMGRIGVDRRLLRTILLEPDAAGAVLNFTRGIREGQRLDLDPVLIDLFRHFGSEEALDFYIDAIRRAPTEVSDELIQALFPFREKSVSKLLALYEEIGEEQGSDIAFALAGLGIQDERILNLLLERLEYDASDGAFALGMYGDPAARGPLEAMLAGIPAADADLRLEITRAIDMLGELTGTVEAEPFDILAEYPERELPAFDVLPESERLELLQSEDVDVRAGAAHSFFNAELNVKSRAALLEAAKSDGNPVVRGRAWASLADSTEDASIRDAMLAVLNDTSKPAEERGGAAVGLYGVADRAEAQQAIEALYETGGYGRAKALEAMWRSLWKPYAKFFPLNLDDKDPKIVREALRGTGYFELTRYSDKIAKFFDAEEPYDHLREDALFAYALAMPGEITRGRVRGMLRKIDALAHLTPFETELVEFALDERLRLHELDPVFGAEHEHEPEPEPPPAPPEKPGRNDLCPCGSGKKYKKCHGQ